MASPPTPITILTGFLGSGKTTIILNLLTQLPATYKLALLKNEFGDLAIDSQLVASSSISGVRELLNGCICCNLVGQLGDALEALRASPTAPDRIVVETSGSAFPATLAMEVNRLARETGRFALDGVVAVVDVENWMGYEDTSYTAKMQAQYTDLVIFNKWEGVGERRFDECLDRLGDLETQTAWVKSDRGVVGADVILGVDGALARQLALSVETQQEHVHRHATSHQSEVEVLSVTMQAPGGVAAGVDLRKLEDFLLRAPRDEVYRIKAVLYASSPPSSSTGYKAVMTNGEGESLSRYILNWAFGRWTFTAASRIPSIEAPEDTGAEPALRMTVVSARYESTKWKKRIESHELLGLEGVEDSRIALQVKRIS